MDAERAQQLADIYRTELTENVIPFWEQRSPDPEYGGFFSCFDREGALYDSTKYTWIQGRFVYMFALLYDRIEPRETWLQASRRGVEFIRQHCFDDSGRMYHAVSREGQRLMPPWTIFSECFAIQAMCQYALASGESAWLEQAQELFWRTVELAQTPDLDGTSYPEAPQLIGHNVPMILLNLVQMLQEAEPDPRYKQVSDEMMHRILDLHVHPEERAVFENVRPDGTLVDSPMGRLLNPGHAIESAWFLLHEAQYRQDETIRDRALQMIDWSLAAGWDEQYGGLLYFVDFKGFPSVFLEWDMKLWWVHVEALYALLLGHYLTGREDLLEWFERIHAWTWEHFPDREYGEWLGYLHRTGKPAVTAKGNAWKGFFHIPRALLLIAELLEEMISEEAG